MHQFICKAVEGKAVPLQQSKSNLLKKLLDSYENLNMKFKLTIEVIDKDINASQISLYKAFILKASKHFGNTYEEMESLLKRFYPISQNGDVKYKKPINKWTSKELTEFIDNASALLAEHGFIFE